MNLENDILNHLLVEDNYYSFFNRNKLPVSNAMKKSLLGRYQADLLNERIIKKYKFSKNCLRHYYHYQKMKDIGKTIIAVYFVIPPALSPFEFEQLLDEIFEIDKRINTVHFYVPLGSKIAKMLLVKGATNNGNHLFGTVENGLSYLKQFDYCSDVVIQDLDKKYLKQAVEVEYWAQRLSKTTRCGTLSRGEIKRFFNHIIKDKMKMILAIEDGQVIGAISLNITDYWVGHIMSISVRPEDQGRGVAKLLYFEALKYLKSLRIKVYTGVSTTTEVLGLAKKLKRQARGAYLELTRGQLS